MFAYVNFFMLVQYLQASNLPLDLETSEGGLTFAWKYYANVEGIEHNP